MCAHIDLATHETRTAVEQLKYNSGVQVSPHNKQKADENT